MEESKERNFILTNEILRSRAEESYRMYEMHVGKSRDGRKSAAMLLRHV